MSRAERILDMCEKNGITGGLGKWHYKITPGKFQHPLAQMRQATPHVGTALTGIGVARGAQAVHRVMRAQTDKVRQAGHGDEYDAAKRDLKIVKAQAKQDHKAGHITRKERKKAVNIQRDKIDDIRDRGLKKHADMLKGTTPTQRQEITRTM